ncbi:hypothetical protein [Spirillospora sp. NPDC047279]|uniref:hypothetical protein n=1 Tax=Spirillospora sp. NPDC047279 TaxID=3155478 RepID=UPI0033C4F693
MRSVQRSSPRPFARAGIMVMAAAVAVPVFAAAAPAEARRVHTCVEHALGTTWWCKHYRHTPLYKYPRPSSVQVATTGPYMEGFFSCRVDDGGASGSPLHPNRWLWHTELGGWLPDGKIGSETDPVRPC